MDIKNEELDIDQLMIKPVAMMTGGELFAIQRKAFAKTKENHTVENFPEFVYGISGIMQLFNCSKSKAQKLKKEVIVDAIDQDQRTIIVDAKKALQLFKEYAKTKKRRFL